MSTGWCPPVSFPALTRIALTAKYSIAQDASYDVMEKSAFAFAKILAKDPNVDATGVNVSGISNFGRAEVRLKPRKRAQTERRQDHQRTSSQS